MKIVCAQSVTHAREAFSTLGDVELVPDEAIGPSHLRDAAALVVRSKTRVGPSMLAGSAVRFVGTCTAGTDHLDLAGLAASGIHAASAAGGNANSVGDYVAAALLTLHRRHGYDPRGRAMAIVGVGHVGGNVSPKAAALGLDVLWNDPPRADGSGDARFRPLEEILPRADVVTLHVPLNEGGPYATRRLAGPAFFARLKPGAVFINASRGEVVDEDALLAARAAGRLRHVVLDVFEGEPAPRPDLLAAADLATPHIAGYSTQGRDGGTALIYRSLCAFLGAAPAWTAPRPPRADIRLDPAAGALEAVGMALRQVYDVEADDQAFRETWAGDSTARAAAFRRLRASYPPRAECPDFRVVGAPAGARPMLKGLGFALD